MQTYWKPTALPHKILHLTKCHRLLVHQIHHAQRRVPKDRRLLESRKRKVKKKRLTQTNRSTERKRQSSRYSWEYNICLSAIHFCGSHTRRNWRRWRKQGSRLVKTSVQERRLNWRPNLFSSLVKSSTSPSEHDHFPFIIRWPLPSISVCNFSFQPIVIFTCERLCVVISEMRIIDNLFRRLWADSTVPRKEYRQRYDHFWALISCCGFPGVHYAQLVMHVVYIVIKRCGNERIKLYFEQLSPHPIFPWFMKHCILLQTNGVHTFPCLYIGLAVYVV